MDAADAGAQLVVLPELANTGYSFASPEELREQAEPFGGPTVASWQELAVELGLVIVGGYAELGDDDKLYNSAVIVSTGGAVNYRKVHLWNRETELFTAGCEEPPVVATPLGYVSVMICYDLEFPEWVRTAAAKGADILCAPVNWPLLPRPDSEVPNEITRVQANASVNRLAIAVADRVGEDRGQDWLGGSIIVDADGYPLGASELGKPNLLLSNVRVLDSRDKSISDRNDVHGDRRPELYREI